MSLTIFQIIYNGFAAVPPNNVKRTLDMLVTKDKTFYRTIVTLAIPMVLQNLITYSVGLADNIMIGALGDSAVSGVYMAGQIQTVLQVISGGIEGAILLLSSQYWGKKDRESICRIVSIGIWCSAITGIIFSFVSAIFPRTVLSVFTSETAVIESGMEYLSAMCYSYVFFCITQALIASMRSVEAAGIGLFVSFCSLCIDVLLNYFLIFGKFGFPAMGIKGAAIATLAARICETVIMFIYVRHIDRKLRFRPKMLFKIDTVFLHDFFRYGLPIIAGQLVWGANLAGSSMIVGHFYGESVITAVSLSGTVNNLMYVCMNGLSGAVGIVIGKTVGTGELSKIREYSRTVQIIFVILGLLTSLLFAVICNPFIGLYSITAEAAEFSRQLIHVLCFTCIGTCYECGCLFGLVKSGGDVSFVFINDMIFVFLVVLPSAYIAASLGLQPWIVFLCLKSDQILKCIVAFFKIRKYNWMKNLTRGAD